MGIEEQGGYPFHQTVTAEDSMPVKKAAEQLKYAPL